MKYPGNKTRLAESLFFVMYNNCDLKKYSNYIEPFVGAAGMLSEVVRSTEYDRKELGITFKTKIGNDLNPYLIKMFQYLQQGWMPPENVDESLYNLARDLSKDISKIKNSNLTIADIGFIGIGCSFGGKWFGGYARGKNLKGTERNYCRESRNALLSQKLYIKDVIFTCESYKDLKITPQSLIYCDPPYEMTTNYRNKFESFLFWDWCDRLVREGHKIFVSEYEAPDNWKCIWEKSRYSFLNKEDKNKIGIEKLFTKFTK